MRKRVSLLTTLALVLAVMAVIFWFSANTGEESGAQSGKIVAAVLGLIRPDFDRLDPARQAQILARTGFAVRKLAHFTEFAALGFALALHIRAVTAFRPVKLPNLTAWSVGTLYAATDEFHQIFVGGRGPSLRDVAIDSAGVLAGIGLLLLLLALRKRLSQKL